MFQTNKKNQILLHPHPEYHFVKRCVLLYYIILFIVINKRVWIINTYVFVLIWYGKKTQAHSLQHFSKILLSHTSIYKTPGNYLFHQPRRVSAALKIEENNKRFIVAHIITCGYFSSRWNRETRYKMIVINRISSYLLLPSAGRQKTIIETGCVSPQDQ